MKQILRFNDFIVVGMHSELIILGLISSEASNKNEKNILIFTETVDTLLILYINALILKQFFQSLYYSKTKLWSLNIL
jgi:hypothetical protein